MADGIAVTRVSTRIEWMDCLRGIAIVLVVIFHAYEIAAGNTRGEIDAVFSFNAIVGTMRMPTMLFLSGLLVPRGLSKGVRRFIEGKVRKVLYPYFMWSALMLVFFAIAARTIGWGFDRQWIPRVLYQPIEHLWFLAYLFLYFFLALALRRVNPIVVAVGCFTLTIAPVAGPWYVFWYYAGFFMLGVAAGLRPALWSRATASLGISCGLLGGAIAIFAADELGFMEIPTVHLYALIVIAAVVGGCGIFMRIGTASLFRPVCYIGANSLVFYLVHWPVIIFSSRVLVRETSLGVYEIFLSTLALALVTCWLFSAALRRFALVQALFILPTLPAIRSIATRRQRSPSFSD